jgi:histidinol dehydrogenase
MLAIPAQIAGCENRTLCTPPRKDGSIDPHILVAASMVGITNIYKIGGVQAIAAMAYGTESVPKVDKIFGPGNSWVTEAKVQVAADPLGATCDMPAGPSEVLVIADKNADPEFVASDLLSQAEHGVDSQVILVSDSEKMIDDVENALRDLSEQLNRKDIIKQCLENSCSLLVDDIKMAIEVSEIYAPEHLILQVENPSTWVDQIQNAGSVFLGAWTPESVGDYASGTNHVLPTFGYTKSLSGLNLDSFSRKMTIQQLSKKGILKLGPIVETMAEVEGLQAHKLAVSLRLKKLSNSQNLDLL